MLRVHLMVSVDMDECGFARAFYLDEPDKQVKISSEVEPNNDVEQETKSGESDSDIPEPATTAETSGTEQNQTNDLASAVEDVKPRPKPENHRPHLFTPVHSFLRHSSSSSLDAKEFRGAHSKDKNNYASLTAEKLLQCTIILSEINRKFTTQNFKPS